MSEERTPMPIGLEGEMQEIEGRVLRTAAERRAVCGALKSLGWTGGMRELRHLPAQVGPLIDRVARRDARPRARFVARVAGWLAVADEKARDGAAERR